MKLSRDGPLPQIELGPTLGGLKVLYQRSGIIARMITMLSAMSAAWSTTAALRDIFLGEFALFLAAAACVLILWMVVDYSLIIPSEQSFNQGQAHRPERSPLKRDTEEIISRLDQLESDNTGSGTQSVATDGGGGEC